MPNVITDPIASLESDLTVFATPKKQGSSGTPADWKSTTGGTPATVLQVAQTLIGFLGSAGSVGSAVSNVCSSLSSALTDTADILNGVGDAIVSVASGAQTPAQAVQTLQNALTTIQTQSPGGSPVFNSGDQFFSALTTYLQTATNDVDATATTAYQLSQQLRAAASALGGK